MGAILCLPCKLLSKICNGSQTFATVLCCFPLSLFAIVASCVLGACGAWSIYSGVHSANFPDYGSIAVIAVGSIQALVGLCGLIAVFFRWTPGTALFKTGYKITVAALSLSLIQQVVMFIEKAIRKEVFTKEEIRDLIVTILLVIAYLIATWWVLSAFASLGRVIAVGGNGWECLNYKDVTKQRALRLQEGKARQRGGESYDDA